MRETYVLSANNKGRYKKQATEMGKASFALAWVMDTGSEERERGVTVDIAQHHFSTETVDFTILDAPGHCDFVPNMIGGATMADLGLLVVDANQLESGMKGQTREHILLAHAIGLQRIVVAVNKLDAASPAWSEDLFESVSEEIRHLLMETGFSKEHVAIVPCSGLSGDNVVRAPSDEPPTNWVTKKHTTLLQQLEKSIRPTVSAELVAKPLRMQIADVFRGGVTSPLSVSGLIRSGNVQVGDRFLVQPSGENASVKGIEVGGVAQDWAAAGQIPILHLSDIEREYLRSGDVACSIVKPIPVVKNVIVSVHAIDTLLPQEADVHVGRSHVAGRISQLFSIMNSRDEVLKKKPRIVKEGQRASIRIVLDHGAPLEPGDRMVLRADGKTIAAGIVQQVGS
jgi:elongation factor 1 alpha-like protein